MFTVEERERVREHVLATARADPRVVAAAEVGSLAVGEGDRFSDLDLTFALTDGASAPEVLADWTNAFGQELEAVQLFDLPVDSTVYRVFLLPGLLQLDVSLTPAAEFHARGPKFALLFGEAGKPVHTAPPSADELLGLAVHHAVRARFSIERGRYWQAEYLLSELRKHTLELACVRLGLPARFGRGVDRLPGDVLDPSEGTLVRAVEPDELRRALERNVEALLREARELGESARKVEPSLRALLA